jgi:multicomponent Na+:H+ antiporter subunit B
MTIDLFILLLIGFMLVAGLIAVETSDLLSAVIAVGAAGFALSVIDLLLGAPDLAFPQVLVEIITVVLLIRMIMTRRDTSRQTPRDTLRTAVVLLGGGVFLVAAFLAVCGLGAGAGVPGFGEPLLAGADPGVSADYLRRFDQDTGAANCVMGILLDYRAYDTLGEATVIFVAIMGGYVVLRKIGRKQPTRESAA